ncbi:MAG TPA: hypothetical protein VGG28_07230 [Kofleriaceae bacterium]|jgi:hypothetical protein
MKYVWLGVAAFCGTAAADPMIDIGGAPAPPEQAPHPVSLDIGPEFARVGVAFPEEMGSPTLHANAEAAHIGVRVNASEHFYAVLGVDAGHLSLTGPYIDSSVPGNPEVPGDPAHGMTESLSGTLVQMTGAVGARAFAGMFSGGAELGGGVRYTTVHDANSTWSLVSYDPIGVARGRVEFWMTPRLTLSALAEVDLQDVRDASFAITFGLHTMDYDAAR